MILKAFKEKSNQKYINNLLNARRVAVRGTQMKSVGVILNMNEFSDFDAFRAFLRLWGFMKLKQRLLDL